MPEIPNVVSGEPVESVWGNDIRDRSVMKYADLTALQASVPFPQLGELAWLNDPGYLVVCVNVAAPGTWNPIYDAVESNGRFVNTSGDTMTGNLTVPNVISNLQGTQEVKIGYTNLSAELFSDTWVTIAEAEAWLPGFVTYETLLTGQWLLNGVDLQTWGGLRILRRSDQAVLTTSTAGPGISLASGAFRSPAAVANVWTFSVGDAYVYQANRQGSGNSGSVRIQTVTIEMRPVVNLGSSVTFLGDLAP